MRKVYLENLPHKGKRINWRESIGYKVNFEYDNIIGELKILEYNSTTEKITLLYGFKEYITGIYDFKNCKFARILGFQSFDYRYEIGQIVDTNIGKIKIKNQIKLKRKNNKFEKGYEYECLFCGHNDSKLETTFNKKYGCPVCFGKKIKIGYNDMWTTAPQLAKLLANPEDGYKYTKSSNKKVDWKCLDCGEIIKNKSINDIGGKIFVCPKCGDNKSYPEKFAYNLLSQLNIDFIMEYSPEWIKPKRYDFYFELNDKKYILEMDGGLGHGEDNPITKQTSDESLKIDNYKDRIAELNNIKIIRINCKKSIFAYIKENIINSDLSNILDLVNIDWLKIQNMAVKSFVKIVCDLWNSGIKSTYEIEKIVRINYSTVRKYLLQGQEIGLCDYTVEKANSLRLQKFKQLKSKPVICLNTNILFDSEKEAKEYYLIKGNSSILYCCEDKFLSAGRHPDTNEPLVWMYLSDYTTEKANEKLYNVKSNEIIQLSLFGEFINRFINISDASKQTNISFNNIYNCCIGKVKLSGNFFWLFAKDYTEENVSLKIKSIKPVIQLDKDKIFINKYPCALDAQKRTGIPSGQISRCCSGDRKTTGGYVWIYEEDYNNLN